MPAVAERLWIQLVSRYVVSHRLRGAATRAATTPRLVALLVGDAAAIHRIAGAGAARFRIPMHVERIEQPAAGRVLRRRHLLQIEVEEIAAVGVGRVLQIGRSRCQP